MMKHGSSIWEATRRGRPFGGEGFVLELESRATGICERGRGAGRQRRCRMRRSN
jgi:hypothetical protein